MIDEDSRCLPLLLFYLLMFMRRGWYCVRSRPPAVSKGWAVQACWRTMAFPSGSWTTAMVASLPTRGKAIAAYRLRWQLEQDASSRPAAQQWVELESPRQLAL